MTDHVNSDRKMVDSLKQALHAITEHARCGFLNPTIFEIFLGGLSESGKVVA
jgi:hypothetical protein